jgi:uncharacterized repeat protein (TIGR01451 family)
VTATGTPLIGSDVSDTDDARAATPPPDPGVGDFVWIDTDRDGVQDATESGFDGAVVNLLDSGGLVVATDTTDASGFYNIFALTAGGPLSPGVDYRVQFIVPTGYDPSPTDQGGDDLLDSDGPTTPVFQLGLAEYNQTLDLGLTQPVIPVASAIIVNKDVCRDGTGVNCRVAVDGDWEPLLAFVPSGSTAVWRITVTNTGLQALDPVVLVDSDVTACSSSTPGPLAPGASYGYVCAGHVVTEAFNAPFVNTVTATGSPVIGSDVTDTDDARIATTPPAPGGSVSIGDYVWTDVNRDGLQTVGEPGLAGVNVELYDSTGGKLVNSTTTDASGYYVFANLVPNTGYVVRFATSTGQAFTTPNVGGNGSDLSDSDADPTTGTISVTTPGAGLNGTANGGVDNPSYDAGIVTVDLSLAKELTSSGPYDAGSRVTFTLTPRNNGSADSLPGWKVTEVLPAGLTLVSMAGSAATSIYTCVGKVCTSTTALKAGSGGETIIVTATISPGAAAMHNVAYVSPGPGEVNELIELITPSTGTDTNGSFTNNDAQASLTAGGRLPSTGSDILPLLYGAGMLGAGSFARLLARRRRMVPIKT